MRDNHMPLVNTGESIASAFDAAIADRTSDAASAVMNLGAAATASKPKRPGRAGKRPVKKFVADED